MKRFIVAVLLAAMLLWPGTSALAASSVYISSNCYVRTGPGGNYDSIGIANAGSSLSYLGDTRYTNGLGWYSVSFHGSSGWVSSKYASLTDWGGVSTYAEGGSGGSRAGDITGSFGYGASIYINGNCNVRTGPSLNYDEYATARKGDVLFGTGDISTDSRGIDWYSVSFKGRAGWVSSTYASLYGFSGSAGSADTRVHGVSGDSRVRTGPGLGYDELGVLYKGNSARFLGKTSVDNRGVAWYNIAWNNGSAWVSSRYTELY